MHVLPWLERPAPDAGGLPRPGRRRALGRVPALTSALTTVALLASGCGSDDAASTDATASGSSSATTASGTSPDVVAAAEAFIATLDEDQQAKALLEFTEENATAWSNLPCGDSCRVGVPLADLSEEQVELAKAVLQASLGTGGGTGYDQATQILLADDYLGESQANGTGGGPGAGGGTMPTDAMPTDAMPTGAMPSGGAGGGAAGGMGGGSYTAYSSEDYLIGFLGTPSADGTWELVFGGHHLATHLTYADGAVTGASPFFIGVEPTTFTTDGTEYAPLDTMHQSMVDMLAGLTDEERATAELTEAYDDVLVGPGEDGQFPETKVGVKVGDLTAEQQELVMTAMTQWVSIADDVTAEELLATYRDELADTYVSWSGGTELDEHADYVRIDGPSVWIEFVCQNGIVFSDEIHYHTVYRDHTRDYGGEISF